MILGIVRDNIVSSKKMPELVGKKLLVVERWNPEMKCGTGEYYAAVDMVGAGVGDIVIGSLDPMHLRHSEESVQRLGLAIVGIVDPLS